MWNEQNNSDLRSSIFVIFLIWSFDHLFSDQLDYFRYSTQSNFLSFCIFLVFPKIEALVSWLVFLYFFWFLFLFVRLLSLLLVMNINYVNYAQRDEGVMCVLFLLFWSLGVVDVDGTQHSQSFSL